MFLEKKTVFTVSGLRDLYKNYVSKAVLAILGLEDQMKIHYAMPVRTMFLDAVDYSNQCKNISQEHRQANLEFLSGMKPEDRILPVLTLVPPGVNAPCNSTRYLRQEHVHEASRRVHYAVASWTHT